MHKKIYTILLFLYFIILSIILLNSSTREVVRNVFFESVFSVLWVFVFIILSITSSKEIVSQNSVYSSSIKQASLYGTKFFGLLFLISSIVLLFSISYLTDLGHGRGEYQSLGEFLLFFVFLGFSGALNLIILFASKKIFQDCVVKSNSGYPNTTKKYSYKSLSLLSLIVGVILVTDCTIFLFTKIEYLRSVSYYNGLEVNQEDSGKQFKMKYEVKEDISFLNQNASTTGLFEKDYFNIDKKIIQDINGDGLKDITFVTQFHTKDRNDSKSFLSIVSLKNSIIKRCLVSEKREHIINFDFNDYRQGKNILIFGYTDDYQNNENRHRYFAKVFDFNTCSLLAEYRENPSMPLDNYNSTESRKNVRPEDVRIENGIVTVQENYSQCVVDIRTLDADTQIECLPNTNTQFAGDSGYNEPNTSLKIDINGDGSLETVSTLGNPDFFKPEYKIIVRNNVGKIIGLYKEESYFRAGITTDNFQDVDGDGSLEYIITRNPFVNQAPLELAFIGF